MPILSFSHWSHKDVERLMGLTAAMTDLTVTPSSLVKIPAFLAVTLKFDPVVFAVLQVNETSPTILHLHTSLAAPSPDFLEVYRRHIVDIFRTRPLAAGEKPPMSAAPAVSGSAPGAHELVFFRSIDARHSLMLIVTWRQPEHAPSDILIDTLNLTAGHLAEFIGAGFSWMADSSVLGSPFDRLTDREWVVLQGLQSEDGEKQLADRLELSPHTLHSHIKSIYRKLGVQGRLPVLLMLENAQRAVRMKIAGQIISQK